MPRWACATWAACGHCARFGLYLSGRLPRPESPAALGLGLSARQDLQLDFDYTGVFTSDAGADETGCQTTCRWTWARRSHCYRQTRACSCSTVWWRRGSTHEVGASLAVAAPRAAVPARGPTITILTDAAPRSLPFCAGELK